MDLFRIARKAYIRDLSGEGAKRYGGRWNHSGTALLYSSSTVSLAAMEILVNTPMNSIPDDLQAMILSVPDTVEPIQIDVHDLPEFWNYWPTPDGLKDFGSLWAKSQSSLLLKVPSAVVPLEWNVLINPAHSDAGLIKIGSVQDFRFDDRLFK